MCVSNYDDSNSKQLPDSSNRPYDIDTYSNFSINGETI